MGEQKEIRFTLQGIHLRMYEQLLEICDRHDHHSLARALIESILEDDAATNQDALRN